MRKVLHKVKSQWVVLGVMGATLVSLGTANAPKVSASEVDGQINTDIITQAENSSIPNIEQVTTTEETTIESVFYTTTEIIDENLEEGKTEVRQAGVNGSQNNTFEVTYTDGVETSRNLLSTVVTSAPTEEIIAVGTKDVIAPVIDVPSIRVSASNAWNGETIHISANITDNKGVTSVEINYLSPITGITKIIPLYKNETNGQFEGTFAVDADTETGTWIAQSISAFDASGNENHLNRESSTFNLADFTVDSPDSVLPSNETTESEDEIILENSNKVLIDAPSEFEGATEAMVGALQISNEIEPANVTSEPAINIATGAALSTSTNFVRLDYVTDGKATISNNYANGLPGLQWLQMDFAKAYDLNSIQLWHYYADGRTYKDVVVQLSNDETFTDSVVTVFNNDKDGSAGLGVGTDSEYSETSAGKTIVFNSANARYARFYSNGSNLNGWNHYIEVEVYGTEAEEPIIEQPVMTNLTPEATLTTSANFDRAHYMTDGQTTTKNNYANGTPGLQWVQMDMGATYDLNAVQLWHYYADGRTYKDVVVQLSNNETFADGVVTVFNNDKNNSAGLGVGTDNEYSETVDGKMIAFNPMSARYVRLYSNGSNMNGWNHYIEIEVYGDELTKTESKTETIIENLSNYTTIEIEDDTFLSGERETIQSGLNGYDSVTYTITYTNGIETSRTEISRDTNELVNEIVRVGTKVVETITEEEIENASAYKVVEQQDNSIPTGVREVIQRGSGGYETVTYSVTYTNGVETDRVETGRQIIAPTDEIVRVGTMVTETKTEIASENVMNYRTVEVSDSTLLAGERKILQSGRNGYDKVVYEVTYINGNETTRTEVSRKKISLLNEIVKVGTKTVETRLKTLTENIVAYNTLVELDNTLPTGKTEITSTGTNGYDTVTYEVTYVNGKEAGRIEIDRITVVPVNEIVRIGTQTIESKTEVMEENAVAFTKIELEDDTVPVGTNVIIQPGSAGYDLVTYEVTYTNGTATNYLELDRETIAPVNEFVKVGTQIIETVTETSTENIVGFTTLIEEDATLRADESLVHQTGANGYDAVTYEVTYTNGVETSRVEVNRQTTAPLNQIIKVGTKISVTNITVTSEDADSIILNGSTLQMSASILPGDATAAEVTWSVEAGTGTATIDSAGLLTATSAGTVTVKATANDGSGVVGSQIIEIAVPISVLGYYGSATEIEIPKFVEYGSYGDFALSDSLDSGKKGIVTDIAYRAFYNKAFSSVVIPDSVTSIGAYAFSGYEYRSTVKLSNVVIPNSVKNIGEYAFAYNDLTNIVIPESVVNIDKYAFASNKLTNIIVPSNVTNIEEYVFSRNNLTDVIISNGVTSIEKGAFAFNYNLNSLIIPSTVKIIGDESFRGGSQYQGTSLTNLVIPEGVINIGANAFSYGRLSNIVIPTSVTSIGSGAFSNNQLTSVAIPNSVTVIGNSAFSNNKLTEVLISKNVTSIGISTFENNFLTNIVIPEAVINVGAYAFQNNLLTSIIIPESVVSVGESAFGNNQLTSVLLPKGLKTLESSVFYNNDLTSIIIPEGVTSIGSYAFGSSSKYANANHLTSIVIPSSVTTIGDYAFALNSLSKLVLSGNVTTIGVKAFYGNPLRELVIPEGTRSIGESAFSNNQLISLVIPASLTNIPKGAFSNNQLTTVDIPKTVTSIGAYAFDNNLLTSVVIPEAVTSIEEYAFNNNQLTSVIIPQGVKSIGQYAFTNNKLTSVVIPKSVTSIGVYAFRNNQLTSIEIPEGVTNIGQYAFNGNQIISAVIPLGVTTIGNNAFSGNKLTHLMIPESVTIIENYAFSENQLTHITIPNSVRIIGYAAFSGNAISSITIGDSVQLGEYILLGNNKFRDAYSIGGRGTYVINQEGDWIKVDVETKNEEVTEAEVEYLTVIQEDTNLAADESYISQLGANGYDTVTYEVAYANGVELYRVEVGRQITDPVTQIIKVGKKVELNNITITSAGDFSIIANGTTLQMAATVLPENANITTVTWSIENGTGSATIDKAGLLTAISTGTVTVKAKANDGSDVTAIKEIEIAKPLTILGYYGTETEIVIPKIIEAGNYGNFSLTDYLSIDEKGIVTSIGENAFSGKQLTNIVIPESVTNIGASAFYNNQLANLILPDFLTNIGNYAFASNKLTDVVIPSSLISIGDGVFGYNQLTNIVIPETVTTIGANAFAGNQLTEVVISSSVISIGESAFYSNKLTNLVIPKNVLTIGTSAFVGNQLTSLTITEGVVSIGINAFGSNKLTSVVIPTSVISIGNNAFQSNQLINVVIPEGITSIGSYAFYNNQLKSIVIPKGVTTIDAYAFYNNQLINVVIPDGVTSIGSYAFSGNSYQDEINGYGNQLTNVTIPSSVTSIGDYAFNRNKLTSVVIPEGVVTIGSYAFYGNQLTSVVIPTSVTSIGDSAFRYNRLTSAVIPEGVTTIGSYAFYGNQLTSVDIPITVTDIGSYAFYNNQLTSNTIPEGVKNIGAYAFYGNQLTSASIPDSVTKIGNNAFEYNRLTSVEISSSVTSIGTQAFNSNQLTSVVIPEGVTSIGNNAFSNNLLSSVDIPNTVSIIGTSAFYNNQLTEIVIPDSVTTIGSYAFQGNQLTSVVIPEGVTFIGNGAFSQNLFTSITIGEGVQVGDSLLGTNNNFRTAYATGGAGVYNGTQDGEWVKIS